MQYQYPRLVSLIRPNLIVGATHYMTRSKKGDFTVNRGDGVVFNLRPGVAEFATIEREAFREQDVIAFWLDRNVASQPFSIANAGEITMSSQFRSSGIANVKDPSRDYILGTPTVRSIQPNVVQFRSNATVTMEPGDSGAPDFVLIGDRPKLIGPHADATPTSWATSTLHLYFPQLSALTK
jgi:hypothetical protein